MSCGQRKLWQVQCVECAVRKGRHPMPELESTPPHLDARVLHTLARSNWFGALSGGAWHRLHALHGARVVCPECSS